MRGRRHGRGPARRALIAAWQAGCLLLLLAACSNLPGAPDSASAPVQAAPGPAIGAEGPLPLVPLPARTERGQGRFVLREDTPVQVAAGDAPAADAARRFLAMTAESTGTTLPLVQDDAGGDPASGAIAFATDPQAPVAAEGYLLDIAADRITIRARDAAGLFYGGVSLWQLLTAGDARLPVALAALRIQDAPRFGWRGFMLDSARHMQSVDEIKRLLEQMARHKLNVFHWHLTDDQGWRLQIRKYPKLTEVGAWRTPAGKAGRGADGKPVRYGGYYTQDQAREIVEYARGLHITVLPEIELPGHAQAAIAAYPRLGVTGQAPPVSPDWGVNTWLYNVDGATFGFLEDVLTEVMAIFPSTYIHIGGDEADKYQWRHSAKVQARRRALGLKDDMALQSWFVKRIETFLVAHDRRLIGWDEILEGGLPPEATVMSWRGMKGAVEAAREGHDVVSTPSDVVYLNRMQSEEADEPPGHDYPTPLKAVYGFEPVPPELDARQARHVLGAQANLWTEHVRTEPRVEHMAFPRLSALAEVAWSPKAARDWDGFLQRLAPQMRRFERAGIRAADSAFAVRFDAAPRGGDGATVSLANQAAFGELRYTTDGSAPTAASPRYDAPLAVAFGRTVAANAFFDGRPLARPRTLQVDAPRLRTRDAEQLAPCKDGALVLRLEDDEPLRPGGADDDRAVVPVDIGTPCWTWKQAPLQGVAALRADVVDLPYNFQFGGESAERPPPVVTKAGPMLQVFAGTCGGRSLGQAPVDGATPLPDTPAIRRIEVPLSGAPAGGDLCLRFTGDHRAVLWAIDRVELLPAGAAR